jgi:hypothetical protein
VVRPPMPHVQRAGISLLSVETEAFLVLLETVTIR